MSFETECLSALIEKYPFVADFIRDNNLDIAEYEKFSLKELLMQFNAEQREEFAIDEVRIIEGLNLYISQMIDFLGLEEQSISSLTILPGYNKSGIKESFEGLTVYPSQVISIVGPTGSGKSRLLADIEWAANADTPTGRTILINNKPVDTRTRFDSQNKLVAQLSQNMNFVMDLSVDEFLQIHAESRLASDIPGIKEKILAAANTLAGEKFDRHSPITALSGGQSRALMIADTAILSTSPIVLIDEIENAGIDRKKAIELLLSEEKIVLIATHDPYLALSADIRIVIGNGGIEAIIETGEQEKLILKELNKMDRIIMNARERLRQGKRIEALE